MTESSLVQCAALLAALLGTAACSKSPEKAGDDCNTSDGCPNGMVCSSDICQIKVGASCQAGGTDYCVGDAVCAADGTGGGRCGTKEGATCDPATTTCAGNLSCAEMADGTTSCQQPVLIEGMVFDAATKAGIVAAQVMALDDRATALTNVAITDSKGNYRLDLPVKRNADASPIDTVIVTLRAAAKDYQTFPGGVRTALPISTKDVQKTNTGWIIKSALTDIALIQLPQDQRGHASISGTVQAGDQSAGVLVVAEGGQGVAPSGYSDRKGKYTVFNVPDGSYKVRGYAAGVQLTPVDEAVAGKDLTNVNLVQSDAALGTVSGSVSIVNPTGGSLTSIVLVPVSTFDPTFQRGDVPRGLRDPLAGPPTVSGAFSIPNVPEGSYKVLAAFENDDLVRDPDLNIAGTQIVQVDMPAPGTTVAVPTSFKITGALPTIGPGKDAPEAVSGNVTLQWGDDASEDYYEVFVYNALGDQVWCHSKQAGCMPVLPAVNGSATVSVPYDGPLDKGMYYQFRAWSWRSAGTTPSPISATEDLRGVFFLPSQ